MWIEYCKAPVAVKMPTVKSTPPIGKKKQKNIPTEANTSRHTSNMPPILKRASASRNINVGIGFFVRCYEDKGDGCNDLTRFIAL